MADLEIGPTKYGEKSKVKYVHVYVYMYSFMPVSISYGRRWDNSISWTFIQYMFAQYLDISINFVDSSGALEQKYLKYK